MTLDDDKCKSDMDRKIRSGPADPVETNGLNYLLGAEGMSSQAGGSRAHTEEELIARQSARLLRLEQDAHELAAHLRETARLPESDRRSIARNLGRLVERRFHDQERAVARRLFERAFGENAAIGMYKKRRRYLRFDGEPLPLNAPSGEYNAHGVTFLKLYEAWLAESGEKPGTEAAWVALIALCDRTAFASGRGPSVVSSKGDRERFEDCMAQLIDRIAKDTDVIDYFSKIRRDRILSYPEDLSELSSDQQEQLRFRRWLPSRFELLSSAHPAYRLISDSRTFFATDLLPQVRIARIYWPRQVLVLPIGINAAPFEVSSHEVIEAKKEGKGEIDPKEIERALIKQKTQDELREKLEKKGLDPDGEYWANFVDPRTNEALNDAEWRRFYQVSSFDLILDANANPESLRLLLQTSGGWSHAANTLRSIRDDLPGAPELEVQRARHGEIVTFLVDDKLMICRPLMLETTAEPIEFDDLYHPLLAPFLNQDEEPIEVRSHTAWKLLSAPMTDPDREARDLGTRFPQNLRPILCPGFSAPEGWAPAPEGSLAAAMMRSLAFGNGPERLDNLLREAIAARINCLSDLHERLERQFQEGMSQHGYEI